MSGGKTVLQTGVVIEARMVSLRITTNFSLADVPLRQLYLSHHPTRP